MIDSLPKPKRETQNENDVKIPPKLVKNKMDSDTTVVGTLHPVIEDLVESIGVDS